MIISSQGFGHYQTGLNNQDFGIEMPKLLLVLDGCSGARCSEVGTRLFSMLLERKENIENVDLFEENVKSVFDDILTFLSKNYKSSKEFQSAIMDTLLFTIIACFETEEAYIVKLFGDGYVISENLQKSISYMRFSYGDYPPYYAYRYTDTEGFKDYDFKTFVFSKNEFLNVGIATDGIKPIVVGDVEGVDEHIRKAHEALVRFDIQSNKQKFYDDVTIAIHGGK